jgi:dihydrodipicolinate reductase
MKKIIKVTIVGGLGRMGRIIAKKIRNNKKFKLNNIIDGPVRCSLYS